MPTKNTEVTATLDAKWGDGSLKLGWTAIPTSLFLLQSKLSITPTAMNVLLNLIVHWWNANESPFPAQNAIALRIGVTKRTVQRSMGELEKLGLIQRTSTSRDNPKFKGRNLYDLAPLATLLSTMTPRLHEEMHSRKKKTSINTKEE